MSNIEKSIPVLATIIGGPIAGAVAAVVVDVVEEIVDAQEDKPTEDKPIEGEKQ